MASDTRSVQDLRIDSRAKDPGRAGWLAWAILALVVAAAAVGWSWSRLPGPVQVKLVALEQGAPEQTGGTVLNASGYVTARRRATVSSKVTGRVTEVLVEEGMAIRRNQVLARLDRTTVDRALALAQAQLHATERAVTETSVRLELSRLTLKRTQQLQSEGIVNQADLDAAEADVKAYEARLAEAEEQVRVSEREVALRENDVADTIIVAPFDGVAISKDAQPGEMISPVSAGGGFTRTGICTVVDMSSLEIEVDVNESYIHRVSPGQRVEATLDAYPDWQIPAKVITMVPTADRQKATVLVRIAFDQLNPRILPDMGVKVAFHGYRGPARVGRRSRAPAAARCSARRRRLSSGLRGNRRRPRRAEGRAGRRHQG